jgi:hypothetical protein
MKKNKATPKSSPKPQSNDTAPNSRQSRSLRAAVNAKCKECIFDPGVAGTWRQQVAGCTSPKCPLFLARPLPKGDGRAASTKSNVGAKRHQEEAVLDYRGGDL